MSSLPVAIAFGALAFTLAALSDIVEARYVQEVAKSAHDTRAPHRAALYSVAMWLVGAIALVAVIEVGWFILPFEALGLYAGSRVALMRR